MKVYIIKRKKSVVPRGLYRTHANIRLFFVADANRITNAKQAFPPRKEKSSNNATMTTTQVYKILY